MNEAKEIDHYREYRAGAGRCCWDSPLHAWLTRAKLDRTERAERAIRESQKAMNEGNWGVAESILDRYLAEQEES